MAWAPDQALSPTLRWPLVASATAFGSERVLRMGGGEWYLGLPLICLPSLYNPTLALAWGWISLAVPLAPLGPAIFWLL